MGAMKALMEPLKGYLSTRDAKIVPQPKIKKELTDILDVCEIGKPLVFKVHEKFPPAYGTQGNA